MTDIDKKLINLKFKKYFSQYEYLEMELLETEYLFNIYNKKFLEECYGEKDSPKIVSLTPEEIEKKLLEEEQKQPIETKDADTEEDINMKKLYRILSLKTHPDKKGGNKKLFHEVNKAYKEKNILKLLTLAAKNDIEINNYYEDSISLFEKNIEEMKLKIENLKKTVAWHWNFSTEEQKQNYKKTLK